MSVWRLLPYQARWVRDASPIKIAEKSRRIGLSWAEAYDNVVHAAAGRGSTTYSSYEKEMTQGWIGDCQEWALGLNNLALEIDEELIEEGGREFTQFAINFPRGKIIKALTSMPRALRSRGRPGDRAVIDEAAFHTNPDALLQAAMANLIWGGRVRIISTHNGETNAFNALVDEVRRGELPYSLHTITFEDAIRDGLYRRILEVQAAADADGDYTWSPEREREWKAGIRASYRYPWMAEEELDCIPAPGGGTWVPLEDYLGCQHEGAGVPAGYTGGPCFVGYDVARRVALAAIAVFEQLGDVLWLRELVVMHNERFGAQRDEIARIMHEYRVIRLAVDQTGMGEPQVEALQDAHGRTRVEGVLLTGPRRLEVATTLLDAFTDRKIRVWKERETRDDIRSMRRAPGTTGAPRLYAKGSETDGHADRFWAFALATAVAEGGEPRYAVHRIDNHRAPPGPGPAGRRGDRFRWRHQRGGLAIRRVWPAWPRRRSAPARRVA